MPDFLASMAEASLERVVAAEAVESRDDLMRRAVESPPGPRLRLSPSGFDLIAEIKPVSPAEGPLAADLTPDGAAELARDLARGGAAAISVLTEPSRFGGSLEHLEAVAGAVDIPVMRKDFLVDTYQLHEARARGARGVLLIVKLLRRDDLVEMVSTAEDLDLFALVECFDAADCAAAAAVSHRDNVLVGLNCRDLSTLQVEPSQFAEMADLAPGSPRVAESGCRTPEDVARVASLGYDMALVGSTLMRADDPTRAVAAMLERGRKARGAA